MKNDTPRVNWRGGLLYTLFIEIEVLVTALFLTFAVYPVRMIFGEGVLRTLLEIVVLLATELVFRFIIFYNLFKNSRRLEFGYFAGGYLITFGIRLVFSLLTSFAAFSAGMAVLEIGVTIAQSTISPDIKTMQEVPKLLYIAVFIAFEGISLLIAYLSYRLAESKRENERKKLLGE
ncbi:MAG: hypothetical protein IJ437_01320 [Clostridia bacterium]|nr:hypothetical protein [Clostridia bacterium]